MNIRKNNTSYKTLMHQWCNTYSGYIAVKTLKGYCYSYVYFLYAHILLVMLLFNITLAGQIFHILLVTS